MTQQARVAPLVGRWEQSVCSWPDDEARAWTRSVVWRASSDPAIVAVVATGSAVREVDRSDDLDLVVVYHNVRPGLCRPPISVDLRFYEQASVPTKLAAGHDYLSWALRFGRPLFERGRWWTSLRCAWDGRLLLPSVAQAEERAERAEGQRDALAAAGDDSAAAELGVTVLTHLARAALSSAGIFPRSRPELSAQLRLVGEDALAGQIEEALARRND